MLASERVRPIAGLVLACLFSISPIAVRAQLPQIRLFSVFPPGGRLGTDVEVVVTGGSDLEGMDGLIFSDPGLVAIPKMADANGDPVPVPNTFLVTIPPTLQPGVYDVRATGQFGVSNPRSFEVTWRNETRESEPNDTTDLATPLPLNGVVNARSDKQADVDVYSFQGQQGQHVLVECRSAVLDSRMSPVVEAFDSHDHRLAIGHSATGADSLLELSLPEDGHYYLKIYDTVYRGGNDYFYRLHLHTDPHIDFVMPPAGLPQTTGTYTLYGRILPGGASAGIETERHRLESLDVQISIPDVDTLFPLYENVPSFEAGNDQFMYALQVRGQRSNWVPIHLAASRVSLEAEPNDTAETAQVVEQPVEIVGQFQSRGDIDQFRFAAQAQEVYWIDVFGQRDSSGADPYLILEQLTLDNDGHVSGTRQVAALDDLPTDLFPEHFSTRSDDVSYRFAVPADGVYCISLRDRYFESRGDPRLVYRLSIRRAHPDFRLAVVPFAPLNGQNNNTAAPWPVGLRRGDNFAVRVLAFRRDGFDGPISLQVDGLPPGVTFQPTRIEPDQVRTALTFTSREDAPPARTAVQVMGKAQIAPATQSTDVPPGTHEVVRAARSGTIVWEGSPQQPAVARVSRGLALCVMDELAPVQITTGVAEIDVNRNRQILIPVKLIRRGGFDGAVGLSLDGQPPNVQVETRPVDKGVTERVQRLFVQPNAPLGTYTLLLRGQGEVLYTRPTTAGRPAENGSEPAKPQKLNTFPPCTPIVLHIRQHPATLTVNVPGDGTVKRGAGIDLPVTVNRVNDFQGPVILSLPLPPGVQGLSAEPVTVAADQNAAVLKIVAAGDATEGALADLVVRATMAFNGDAAVDQPVTLKVVP